ncbi:MAG: methionyl-tRNA formyltransferase [Pseudomonadota bacterium]|jgi:methionyl-tRNA formyltransferase
MRLVFMGTPEFSVPCLRALRAAGHEIAAVYCQPPRASGRGMMERKSPVQLFAEAEGLTVRAPARLKDPAEHDAFAALYPDAAVVVAYGLLLPVAILQAPRLGCLNAHASLLPRWRGAAPIQRAIMAGDRETGVTIMQMDAGMDTGPMLLWERESITPEDTAGALHDRLSLLSARLMTLALAGLAAGELKAQPQPEAGVTHAAKISKEETRIDWRRPARALDCHIRGLTPSPGAWFGAPQNGREIRIKVLRAQPVSGAGPAGTVLGDAPLTIACGEGALRLETLQREGKAPTGSSDFLRGFPLARGAVLA